MLQLLAQIKYFQAVVRCGNFTEAAEECYISQSAVSQGIQALERGLGVKLLLREHRGFKLTPAGEHFYKKSLSLTGDFEKLCRETVRLARADEPRLAIGYLRCYGGHEFHEAVAEFAAKYPQVEIQIVNGSHEDLYDGLRTGGVDLVLNDQRRAFSDEYVNFILASCECFVEVPSRGFLAGLASVGLEELRNYACILVASEKQRRGEQDYYQNTLGFAGEFLFADSLEEARLLVTSGKGFLPIEGGDCPPQYAASIRRIPLCRSGRQIARRYCAFWKKDNSGRWVEEFAAILKSKFQEQ